jgi:hypothetical protein
MQRVVVTARVSSDGSLHLDLPVGDEHAGTEVQVTVEPLPGAARRPLRASDLLHSGLVGLWGDRTDIANNHEFARRLRDQAQTRRQDS